MCDRGCGVLFVVVVCLFESLLSEVDALSVSCFEPLAGCLGSVLCAGFHGPLTRRKREHVCVGGPCSLLSAWDARRWRDVSSRVVGVWPCSAK